MRHLERPLKLLHLQFSFEREQRRESYLCCWQTRHILKGAAGLLPELSELNFIDKIVWGFFCVYLLLMNFYWKWIFSVSLLNVLFNLVLFSPLKGAPLNLLYSKFSLFKEIPLLVTAQLRKSWHFFLTFQAKSTFPKHIWFMMETKFERKQIFICSTKVLRFWYGDF